MMIIEIISVIIDYNYHSDDNKENANNDND